MKKVEIIIIVFFLFLFSSCNNSVELCEIKEMKSMSNLIISRSSHIVNSYPNVDISKIECLPVYRLSSLKNAGGVKKTYDVIEYFNINLDFRDPKNCLDIVSYGECISSNHEYDLNGIICADLSKENNIYLIFDHSKIDNYMYGNIIFKGYDGFSSFSARDYRCDKNGVFEMLNVSFPEWVYNMNYKLDYLNNKCEIDKKEEAALAEFFAEYINNTEVFPFLAKESYIESKKSGIWAMENDDIYGGCTTEINFYKNGASDETTVLLGYYGFIDRITASYTIDTFGVYSSEKADNEFHEVKFEIFQSEHAYEKIGNYELLSYTEAKTQFDKDVNVYYSEDANAETIKDYSVYLVYGIDSKGYARPIYVKQAKGNIGNFNVNCGWIDAIKW